MVSVPIRSNTRCIYAWSNFLTGTKIGNGFFLTWDFAKYVMEV